MKIAAIKKEDLNVLWPTVLPMFECALEFEHGQLTPEKIYNRIMAGNLVLLVALDEDDKIVAEQTLEVWKTETETICNLVTTGGNRMNEWLTDMAEVIDKLAVEFDCDVIRTRGRLGWLKVLKSQGYEPMYFVAQKRVNA